MEIKAGRAYTIHPSTTFCIFYSSLNVMGLTTIEFINAGSKQMKTILIMLFIITTAKVNAQDYKKIYWKYADSMWMKHFQRDTIAKNRYIDSMAKYSRFDAISGKRLK